ncbi:hypothetical protein MHO82_23745 [Vibrio sp. Of7-15]|uniref:hypothetical protein n=1 Tax=Vibrio sp. Of7-15 TaxID=2724879 RepID=UPI001EF20004|nr:hypothetical protein [Vibrio sp. Of7-15]MCG7499884.1 hypothetical protein [Vibrio sp. Of7-15]
MYASVESGGEKVVDLLLKNIDYDSETLGQSLNYVYHNNDIDKNVAISIFRKILSLSPSLEFNDSEFESHLLSCLFTYNYLFETLWDFYPDAQDLDSFESWVDVLDSLNGEKISNLASNLNKIKGCFGSDKLLLAIRDEKYKEISDVFK